MRFKSLSSFCQLFLLVLSTGCRESAKKDSIAVGSSDSTSISHSKEIFNKKNDPVLMVSDDPENNSKRLDLIKETINNYGFLELPYTYHYEGDLGGVSGKIDRNQFNEAGIGFSSFIGVSPDTTDNYYILSSMALDVDYLYVSCINKKGEYLHYNKGKNLMDCNCLHMVEDDIYCNEYATIKEGLALEYYYKSKYILSLVDEQSDTICDFKFSTGYISTKEFGKIVYDKTTERNCQDDEP